MTSGQKIAFSLLVAIGLFAVFVLSLNQKLFNELETRFYAQAKIAENTAQLDRISEGCDSYITEILNLTEKGENAWVKNASVRSFYVQNASESDVTARRKLTEQLFADIPALNGIRIVDKNGKNVHYSSFDDTDLLKQNGISKLYKNYGDIVKDSSEIPFENLEKIISETKSVLLFDQDRARIILSVPFCWVDGIYSGVALFYLNTNTIEAELNNREVIPLGQSVAFISDSDYSGGFIFNLPYGEKKAFEEPVRKYWKNKTSSSQLEKLLEKPDGGFYVALSSNRSGKLSISAVYPASSFELSKEIRVLIYVSIFISMLLIIFLIFSFFRDPVVTLQKRIKKLQLGIIENYIDGREKREWTDIARQLRGRKNDLSSEIIKSLHVHSKKRRKELSEYLDKNWDEIFAIFEAKAESSGGNTGTVNSQSSVAAQNSGNPVGAAELTGASIAEIRRVLEEVLQSKNIVNAVAGVAAGVAASTGAVVSKGKSVDEVEELDDAEELEDVEEIEEVEELAEEADEVEELDEVEDLDEVEELSEEADELESVEDLDEVEELDEAEELDEVEELDDADDVEELKEEPAEAAEEIDEIEELEEEPVEAAKELDEVEELDDAEDVEELEELEEVEEPAPSTPSKDDPFRSIASRRPLDYVPSNETYFASEKFANTDNLYAEELCLGGGIVIPKETTLEDQFLESDIINVTVYPLPDYEEPKKNAEQNETDEQKETAELKEVVEPEVTEETVEAEASEESVEEDVEVEVSEEERTEPAEEIPEMEEEVSDLTEEVQIEYGNPAFSLTDFADNFEADIPELEDAVSSDDVIIETDGVYSISENLKYTNIIQDPEFKELVDSIL